MVNLPLEVPLKVRDSVLFAIPEVVGSNFTTSRVDSDLADFHRVLEVACADPGAREDRRAVALRVSVDILDGSVERGRLQADECWPKYLVRVATHCRGDFACIAPSGHPPPSVRWLAS